MTPKKLQTTILIIALAAIWGLIAIRIFSSLETPESNITISKRPILENTPSHDSLSYTLSLNYPDPFKIPAKSIKRTTAINPSLASGEQKGKAIKPKVLTKKSTSMTWPSVKYFGTMKSHSQKSPIALLSIKNEQYFLQKGEEAHLIKVIQVWEDSVQLSFFSESKTIVR